MFESIWEWLRFNKDSLLALAPFFAALAGFGGVLRAQHVVIKARRQEALDDWWYNRAITEGTESIVNFMAVLQHRIAKHTGYERVSDIQPYPLDSLNNLKIIVPCKMLDWLMMNAADVDEYGVPEEYLQKFSSVMAEVMGKLTELSVVLVDIQLQKRAICLKFVCAPKYTKSPKKLIK